MILMVERKPLAIDLYCGLGGWTEGLLAEGYNVVGFDIERHIYGEHRYPAQLVLQDVRTIDGAQLRDAALIVASPPCQRYSYMAMPWTRAKKIAEEYRSGVRDVGELNELFDACFRIQREAIEASTCRACADWHITAYCDACQGTRRRFIPLVVENVRGAQPWVGRSRWSYGSYHLWGDVPALMPITLGRPVMKRGIAHRGGGATNFHDHDGGTKIPSENARRTAIGNGARFTSDESVEVGGVRGDDWFTHHNREGFTDRATKNDGGSWFNIAHNTSSGHGHNPVNRHDADGVKGFTPNGQPLGKNELGRKHGSKSSARKAASAKVAKIPLPLARHIARSYYPKPEYDFVSGACR
jgi:hypothetical protein